MVSKAQLDYYKSLGDIIHIWWALHQKRLEDGDTEFAFNIHIENFQNARNNIKFNKCLLKMDDLRTIEHGGPNDIFIFYAKSVITSMELSLETFMKDSKISVYRYLPVEHLAKQYHMFSRSDYTANLILHGLQAAKVFYSNNDVRPDFSLEQTLRGGLQNAILFTTQYAAMQQMYGEDFPFDKALHAVAKIPFLSLLIARRKSGLVDDPLFESAKYDLFDPESPNGVSVKELKRLQYGTTVGCPAGLRISTECRKFLEEECGVSIPAEPMLYSFSRRIQEGFKEYVVDWYNTLNPIEKRALVKPEQISILEGTIPMRKLI